MYIDFFTDFVRALVDMEYDIYIISSLSIIDSIFMIEYTRIAIRFLILGSPILFPFQSS